MKLENFSETNLQKQTKSCPSTQTLKIYSHQLLMNQNELHLDQLQLIVMTSLMQQILQLNKILSMFQSDMRDSLEWFNLMLVPL